MRDTAIGLLFRRLGAALAALGAALAIALAPQPAGAQSRLPQSQEELKLSFAPLVKRAAPAVVNIYARRVVRTRSVSPLFDDPFFRRFFGEGFNLGLPREQVQNSLGSGVIVRGDGLIVTNHHVIEGADQITVVLADRREFAAALIGSDERTDLAVLRMEKPPAELAWLELGDSDALEVGDLVLAIGNPFGVGQTVTSGIVSALARTGVGVSDLNFFIQTDAAINPGNSGGALLTMDGKLVGINSAIYSRTGGSHGIGFAVPANMVRSVLAGFTQVGRLVRPWLGAWGQPVAAEMAQNLGLGRPAGVLINEVYPGGPAADAGLAVGDVVLRVDGRAVDDPAALRFRLATLAVGGQARLAVWRGGRERELKLKLVEPPEVPPRALTEIGGQTPLTGAVVANMSPALADDLGLERFRPGVTVVDVRAGSPAARLQFQAGDQIVSVQGREVARVDDLKAALGRSDRRWSLAIRRGNRVLNVTFE